MRARPAPSSFIRTAIALAACAAALALAGACSGDNPEPEGKKVVGTEGRERWIVVFDKAEPDLAEYRKLLKDNPAEAEAYADKMRNKLRHDRADFETALSAVNGKVVEHWWMSGALTVEVEAGGVPTLQKSAGVKSVSPDVLLGE